MGTPRPETRQAILSFIKAYLTEQGYTPTVREIMRGVGMRSTSGVHYQLGVLQREGHVRLDYLDTGSKRGRPRAIALTHPQGCCPLCGK